MIHAPRGAKRGPLESEVEVATLAAPRSSNDHLNMEKLTAIVTGGSQGVGEEICRHLLRAGATVVNLDIQAPRNAQSGDYHFERVDLSDPTETRKVAAAIAGKFPVNCLVNNAGTPNPALLDLFRKNNPPEVAPNAFYRPWSSVEAGRPMTVRAR